MKPLPFKPYVPWWHYARYLGWFYSWREHRRLKRAEKQRLTTWTPITYLRAAYYRTDNGQPVVRWTILLKTRPTGERKLEVIGPDSKLYNIEDHGVWQVAKTWESGLFTNEQIQEFAVKSNNKQIS